MYISPCLHIKSVKVKLFIYYRRLILQACPLISTLVNLYHPSPIPHCVKSK